MSYVEKQLYNLKSDFNIFFSTVLILDWWRCDVMECIVLTVSLLQFFWNTEAFCSCVFFKHTFSTVSVCHWAICIRKLEQNPLFHRRKWDFDFAQNTLWVWSLSDKKARVLFHIIWASSFYQLCHYSQSGEHAIHKILNLEMLLLDITVLLVTLRTVSCDYIDTEKEVYGKERGIINHST